MNRIDTPQIEFAEWTQDGHLRHSKFIGLREDKDGAQALASTTSEGPFLHQAKQHN
jgi:ATP-dependent DNA ligase